MNQNIIFIDSDCSLCSRFVLFVMKYDKKQIFKFFPFNNENGVLKTIVLLENGNLLTRYTAISSIFKKFNFLFFIIFSLLDIFPKFIANKVYDFIANNRNALFGEYCIPIPLDKKVQESEIAPEILEKAKNKSLDFE